MRFFSRIYAKVLELSLHRHAPYYLMGLSFAEASFFPIPPDVMLAPMALAKPEKAWRYAMLTTLFSIIGGFFGYLLGMFFWALLQPLIVKAGYLPEYEQVQQWFHYYGFWAVVIAGFTPIPYKIFTITAGAMAMPVAPFFLAATIGRSMRFYLVAGLMLWGGEKMREGLKRVVDWLGWILIILVVILVYLFH